MARNRKHRTVATRFGPALKAFLACVLIGGSGVGYVWQKNQIANLGRQIKQRELRVAELEDRNDKLRKQLATLRSPAYLDQRVKDLKLGLVPAAPGQVLRLIEPVPDLPVPSGPVQYAASRGSPGRNP
jgi:hypothetical protein